MRWLSFAVSVVLLAVGFVAFPAPPSPLGLGVFMLGVLLLLDWSWESSIGYAAWGGLETRSKDIKTDFYRIDHAKWRYLLASVIAGVNGAIAATSASEVMQAVVLIGSAALFALYGLFDILRCRKRVSDLP
jgi:hypothetical protein